MGTENDATLLVRLPRELKAELMRQAAINGRRITVEINMRLSASLESPAPNTPNQPLATYPTQPVQALTTEDRPKEGNGDTLNDHDRAVLALFRQLPPEKQLSLLTLLR